MAKVMCRSAAPICTRSHNSNAKSKAQFCGLHRRLKLDEIKKDMIKEAAGMIKEVMENVAKLRVPLEVEISAGKNWGELKKLDK